MTEQTKIEDAHRRMVALALQEIPELGADGTRESMSTLLEDSLDLRLHTWQDGERIGHTLETMNELEGKQAMEGEGWPPVWTESMGKSFQWAKIGLSKPTRERIARRQAERRTKQRQDLLKYHTRTAKEVRRLIPGASNEEAYRSPDVDPPRLESRVNTAIRVVSAADEARDEIDHELIIHGKGVGPMARDGEDWPPQWEEELTRYMKGRGGQLRDRKWTEERNEQAEHDLAHLRMVRELISRFGALGSQEEMPEPVWNEMLGTVDSTLEREVVLCSYPDAKDEDTIHQLTLGGTLVESRSTSIEEWAFDWHERLKAHLGD